MDLLLTDLHGIAQAVHKSRKRAHLILLRRLVGTIQEGRLQPVKMLRHRFVCQKHEILDQPGGRIALLRQDLRRTAVLIQSDPALRKVKIHGSPLMSPLPDQAGKPGHIP